MTNYLKLIGIYNNVVITSLEESRIKIVILAQFDHIRPKQFVPLIDFFAQLGVCLYT